MYSFFGFLLDWHWHVSRSWSGFWGMVLLCSSWCWTDAWVILINDAGLPSYIVKVSPLVSSPPFYGGDLSLLGGVLSSPHLWWSSGWTLIHELNGHFSWVLIFIEYEYWTLLSGLLDAYDTLVDYCDFVLWHNSTLQIKRDSTLLFIIYYLWCIEIIAQWYFLLYLKRQCTIFVYKFCVYPVFRYSGSGSPDLCQTPSTGCFFVSILILHVTIRITATEAVFGWWGLERGYSGRN